MNKNCYEFMIGERLIGDSSKPFIIAEMSGNHNKSKENALGIIRAAADSGVDAIKLQTYTADTMTLDSKEGEFFIKDPDNIWAGNSLYDLYDEAHTPWDWHEELFNLAHELGLIIFSSPFDNTAVDLLEDLNVPCYKIASFENTDLPLIKRVAETKKPIIMSTGMATISEIAESVEAAKDAGCKDLVLLKCTSTYPASPEDSNLLTIPHMKDLFKCQIGLSDHTMGVGVAIGSIALGATVIEKHFTIDRADGGVDSTFSMEPAEMGQLVVEAERAWQAKGAIAYGPTAKEVGSRKYRRSLYASCDIKAGEVASPDNIRAIRPGLGLPPKYLEVIKGQKFSLDVRKGTPIDWSLFK